MFDFQNLDRTAVFKMQQIIICICQKEGRDSVYLSPLYFFKGSIFSVCCYAFLNQFYHTCLPVDFILILGIKTDTGYAHQKSVEIPGISLVYLYQNYTKNFIPMGFIEKMVVLSPSSVHLHQELQLMDKNVSIFPIKKCIKELACVAFGFTYCRSY